MQYVQSQAYADVIKALAQNRNETKSSKMNRGVKKTSSIYGVDPVLDGELLRGGGRQSRASIPGDAKHPVILPKSNHVSTLILRRIHETSGHSGRNRVLACL